MRKRFQSSAPFPKAETPTQKPMSAGAPVERLLRATDIKPAELIKGRTRGVELVSLKADPAIPKNAVMYTVFIPPAVLNCLFKRRKPELR